MINSQSHVVIQTAFLGDLFLSIPLFEKIKQQYPNDLLVLVCKKGLGDYFLQEKIVDRVFEVVKGDRRSYKKAIQEISKLSVANLFCIHRSLRSQLMSLQIKAKNKVGFKSPSSFFFFNQQVHFQKSWPEPLRQLQILRTTNLVINKQLSEKDWSFLNHPDSEGNLPEVPVNFRNNPTVPLEIKRQIALFPGSVWATKKWTTQGFAEVASWFVAEGYRVYLMGGPDEKDLCEQIQSLAPGSQVLAGLKSIHQSVEIIKNCSLVISNDSAPAHMAASQNIPVLALFGPTTLDLGFRPWTSKVKIIENNKLDCRPCGRHGHQRCPLGHHRCMNEISAQWVIQGALHLIKLNP